MVAARFVPGIVCMMHLPICKIFEDILRWQSHHAWRRWPSRKGPQTSVCDDQFPLLQSSQYSTVFLELVVSPSAGSSSFPNMRRSKTLSHLYNEANVGKVGDGIGGRNAQPTVEEELGDGVGERNAAPPPETTSDQDADTERHTSWLKTYERRGKKHPLNDSAAERHTSLLKTYERRGKKHPSETPLNDSATCSPPPPQVNVNVVLQRVMTRTVKFPDRLGYSGVSTPVNSMHEQRRKRFQKG